MTHVPASLQLGRIVWAEIADARGYRKKRPAVIVTASEHVGQAGSFEVVAVTSRLPEKLPSDHVLLPWHSQGHPRTGLNRNCAAACGWVVRIKRVLRPPILRSLGLLWPAAPESCILRPLNLADKGRPRRECPAGGSGRELTLTLRSTLLLVWEAARESFARFKQPQRPCHAGRGFIQPVPSDVR
jgi:mRNA-degrading endonuclease toxin of MazEF toxin-antitoxin module